MKVSNNKIAVAVLLATFIGVLIYWNLGGKKTSQKSEDIHRTIMLEQSSSIRPNKFTINPSNDPLAKLPKRVPVQPKVSLDNGASPQVKDFHSGNNILVQ